MSRDKKWSSNDKNQLLVENFRKFMEEGDFSTNPGKGPRLLAESSLAALDDAASYGSAIATSIKQSLFANRDPETFIKRIERIMYDEPGEGTHGSKRSTDDRLGIQGGTERMLNAFKKATGKGENWFPCATTFVKFTTLLQTNGIPSPPVATMTQATKCPSLVALRRQFKIWI